MSRLVARLLLSMLLFPLAGIVYLVTLVVLIETYWRWRDEVTVFSICGIVSWIFMGIYWFALWRGSVQFTVERVRNTTIMVLLAVLAGMGIGFVVGSLEDGVGAFVGSIAAPLLWLVGTVVIWRETPQERGARLRSVKAGGVICPTCGYNLTGLNSARCPECGAQFTLDELLASQPAHAGEELVQ